MAGFAFKYPDQNASRHTPNQRIATSEEIVTSLSELQPSGKNLISQVEEDRCQSSLNLPNDNFGLLVQSLIMPIIYCTLTQQIKNADREAK